MILATYVLFAMLFDYTQLILLQTYQGELAITPITENNVLGNCTAKLPAAIG